VPLSCVAYPVRLFSDTGQIIELVDSKTLCSVLSISKPETLIKMAKRGDLPSPIHLNAVNRHKRGRNAVRWNLPEVLGHLGLD